MPHNDNYFRNILRQRLRDYSPAGEGLPLPRKNITRYKSNYLHHVRTECLMCIHVPVHCVFNTIQLSEICDFRVSAFCHVVQKHKLFQVA